MAQPVSFFVHLDHSPTEQERAQVTQHEATWRTRLGPGASAFALQPVEPPAQVTEEGEGIAARDRMFAARLREADLRTLVELDLKLRGTPRPTSAQVDEAFDRGTLRYAGRVHLGPAQTQTLLMLLESLRALQGALPQAEVRVHDGQLLRYARVLEVDVDHLRHQLGR